MLVLRLMEMTVHEHFSTAVLDFLDAWSARPVSEWMSKAATMKTQGGPWVAAERARRSALMHGVSAFAVWSVLDLCETAWMLAPRDCSVSDAAATAALAAVQCLALTRLVGTQNAADVA